MTNTTTSTAFTSTITGAGAKVRLPDGTEAMAYPDRRAGNGTYITAQPSSHGGPRTDTGWRRDQLEVIG